MTTPEPTPLREALDNLLRHHNSGSQHQDTARRNFECEFARQARAALATPPAALDVERLRALIHNEICMERASHDMTLGRCADVARAAYQQEGEQP